MFKNILVPTDGSDLAAKAVEQAVLFAKEIGAKITAVTITEPSNLLSVSPTQLASVPGVDVLLIGPSDLSIELGVPLDYQCDIYQRALDKIAATAAKHGIAAGMYFIPPEMDPNFFVQKGFKFFTMPWGPWAKAGIQDGLAGIKR